MTPWRRLTTLGDTLEKVRLAFQGPEGVKPNQANHNGAISFFPAFWANDSIGKNTNPFSVCVFCVCR